jgi:hypothetical protein
MDLRAIILVVILGFAAGGVSVSVRPAAGGVAHSHLYTHSGSGSCTSHVDPINDVFVQFAYYAWADNHAGHHGGWGNNSGGTQKFAAHTCLPMDAQAASNPSYDPGGRYHMRFGQGWTSAGVGNYDFDTASFIWATADAHHEDSVLCGGNPFSHAIDDNVGEPSGGFNRGRDGVWNNWTNEGADYPHVYVKAEYWNNTMHFTQCNGNVAWSDGVVDFIEVLYYSGH